MATDGTLACWGDPLGLPNLLSPPAGSDFVDVAMGDQHGCALRTTGELHCWGYELSGEISPPSALRLTTLTTRRSLEHLRTLWSHDVVLETRMRGRPAVMTSSGEGFDAKLLA